MGEQFVNELGAPAGILAGDELGSAFADGNSADQIKVNAAHELRVVGARRTRDLRRCQFFLDEPIDRAGGFIRPRALDLAAPA